MPDLKMPPPPTPTGDARRVADGPCARCRQTRPRFARPRTQAAVDGRVYLTDLLCPRCWSARHDED